MRPGVYFGGIASGINAGWNDGDRFLLGGYSSRPKSHCMQSGWPPSEEPSYASHMVRHLPCLTRRDTGDNNCMYDVDGRQIIPALIDWNIFIDARQKILMESSLEKGERCWQGAWFVRDCQRFCFSDNWMNFCRLFGLADHLYGELDGLCVLGLECISPTWRRISWIYV